MKSKINQKRFTSHAYKRVFERVDIKDVSFETLCIYAKKNGLDYGQLPEGPLRTYLYLKHEKRNKKAKIYRGYVFIFFNNSKKLITCYPLPDKYQEEYNTFLKELEGKKK